MNWFRSLTAAQKAKMVALVITLCGTVEAVGATLKPIPGLPGWVASLWPFFYGAAYLIHQLAAIFDPNAKPADQQPPSPPSANPFQGVQKP